ncbi:MAG: polysaccharide biosynthesis/export family protein [Bacteroidales bacterium]|nr:polysaccharide biosynthesis/export family protein [Bacteroidales bacterium]
MFQIIGRFFKISVLSFIFVTLFAACHHREIAYVSDATRDSAQQVLSVYDNTILPGDQLYIHVASLTPESVVPFNQESRMLHLASNSVVEEDGEQETEYVNVDISGYTVNDMGTITFPVLGEISVVGITHDSLCHYLESRLKSEGYVIDPQVTTKLLNFRVTVVGEVAQPQQIHVNGTRLTILEALAICGDLTIYGQRENVTIMRVEKGKKEIGELNLTSKEMFDSPYYYLHNNDIVYVEPNKYLKRSSDRDPNVPNYISMGVSVWNIIRTTRDNTRRIRAMNNQ